jgi:hypothetical protein
MRAEFKAFLPWRKPAPYSLTCLPYRAQRANMSDCMEVCLHMLVDFAHVHLDSRRLPDSFIDNLKSNSSNRPLAGLSAHQVRRVISSLGLTPVQYIASNASQGPRAGLSVESLDASREVRPEALVEMLHAYVDSQLPVILVLDRHERTKHEDGRVADVRGDGRVERHAVLAVGHKVRGGATTVPEHDPIHDQLRFHTTTDYVAEFIVHDGDVGPYKVLDTSGPGC